MGWVNFFDNYDLLCSWAIQKDRERKSREMEAAMGVEGVVLDRRRNKGLYEEVAFEQ